jgi:hypothetical protein
MPSKDKAIEKKKDYVKGDALKGTTPDFSAENFKTKDVMKWSEIKKGHDKIEPIKLPGLSTLANKTKLPRYKNQ